MNKSTLILNADASPISLIPISSISWQESCKLLYMGHASVLHEYEDWKVRSQHTYYIIPSVMILNKQINLKKKNRWEKSRYPASRMVFLRDGYTCQYCLNQFTTDDLTIDHVVPKAYNGKTTWENVSTACVKCNHSRGHNMNIQPKTKPFKPTYNYLIKMKKKFPIIIPHSTWNYYLGWDDNLVKVGS